MIDLLLSHEMLLRLVPFLGVFALMAVLEAWVPRRARGLPRSTRWPSNLGIVVVDTLVVRLLFPTAAVGVALAVEAQGGGLLGWLAAPAWLSVLIAILLLDLAIYLQQVMFHALLALW